MNNQDLHKEAMKSYDMRRYSKMMFGILLLALIGLCTVLWYFIFKDESLGKQAFKYSAEKLSETGKDIMNALSSTSSVSV